MKQLQSCSQPEGLQRTCASCALGNIAGETRCGDSNAIMLSTSSALTDGASCVDLLSCRSFVSLMFVHLVFSKLSVATYCRLLSQRTGARCCPVCKDPLQM